MLLKSLISFVALDRLATMYSLIRLPLADSERASALTLFEQPAIRVLHQPAAPITSCRLRAREQRTSTISL